MKSQIAQTTRGRIEYTLLGSGPVVLVCHGTSSDCTSTEMASSLIEAGYSVLTPSRPGYGRTPLETGRSAGDFAETLTALLDALNIKTCAVVAISGGGPTGVALAASYPERVTHLVLAAALTHPEGRTYEPLYKNQMAFYGPLHSVTWSMLGLMSRISPRRMALQTLVIFSTHDPDDGLSRLSADEIKQICQFYHGYSSRRGALNDATHGVGEALLRAVHQPTLVIHSREDKAVPFGHAEWSLKHILNTDLVEGGFTGHFFWIGPDFDRISDGLIAFLNG